MGVEDSGILASEDLIAADSENKSVWFHQHPKYDPQSDSQETMASFRVKSALVSAIKAMYKGQIAAGSVLGDLIPKLQASGGLIEFFLSNVSASERDRYYIAETLGTNFTVFGMGKEPEILSCTGILKNTTQDDWQVQFIELFNKIGGVRALGKLYQYGASTGKFNQNFLEFTYNKRKLRGALLNVSTALVATNEMDMALSFSFLVTKVVSEAEDISKKSATAGVTILKKKVAIGGGTSKKNVNQKVATSTPARDEQKNTSREIFLQKKESREKLANELNSDLDQSLYGTTYNSGVTTTGN